MRYTIAERGVDLARDHHALHGSGALQEGGRRGRSRYASTVRVGGRRFAAVEIDGLAEDTFYYYTIELAPLPAQGAIPVDQGRLSESLPDPDQERLQSIKDQLRLLSLDKTK